MRGLLIIVLLAATTGLAAWFLLGGSVGGDGDGYELDPDGVGDEAGAGEEQPAPSMLKATAVVAGPALWNDKELAEAEPFLIDRVDVALVRESEGKVTGGELLDLLARHRPDLPIRFKDQAALDAFRKAQIPQVFPSHVLLGDILGLSPLIGYRPIDSRGAVYMVPVDTPENQ